MSPSAPRPPSPHGVAVACQRLDGRWLLIRRSAHVSSPLRVCFPGGWVEPGESQAAAVVREMREELNADVIPARCVWNHSFAARSLTLWGWLATLQSPILTCNPAEVDDILWLTAAEALSHPDLLPHTDSLLAALLAST